MKIVPKAIFQNWHLKIKFNLEVVVEKHRAGDIQHCPQTSSSQCRNDINEKTDPHLSRSLFLGYHLRCDPWHLRFDESGRSVDRTTSGEHERIVPEAAVPAATASLWLMTVWNYVCLTIHFVPDPLAHPSRAFALPQRKVMKYVLKDVVV